MPEGVRLPVPRRLIGRPRIRADVHALNELHVQGDDIGRAIGTSWWFDPADTEPFRRFTLDTLPGFLTPHGASAAEYVPYVAVRLPPARGPAGVSCAVVTEPSLEGSRMKRPFTLALILGLVLASCGDDDDVTSDAGSGSTSTAPAVDEPSSTTAAPAPDDYPQPSATEAPAVETTTVGAETDELVSTVIRIDVVGGGVTGGGRYSVAVGSEVSVQVTADVVDEVHVHGYDLTTDTVPGDAVELTFTADIPGVFEAELEEAGLPLFELEVQ